MKDDGLLNYIKQHHFALFEMLLEAKQKGLVVLDAGEDSLSATHGLYKAYPGLQGILNKIVDDWVNRKMHPKQTSTAGSNTADPRLAAVHQLFDTILAPQSVWNMNALSLVDRIAIDGNRVHIALRLLVEDAAEKTSLQNTITEKLKLHAFDAVEIQFVPNCLEGVGIKDVKKVLLVASGKGGVGKSTIAYYLAKALASTNLKVGLLDADISGPSLPTLIGALPRPAVKGNGILAPILYQNIKLMSPGFLVERDKAIDWRGPVVSGEVVQLLHQVDWGQLDYLIVDLPPGTSDVALTLAHHVWDASVLFVATAHPLTVADVTRAVDFFRQRDFNCLGFINNMRDLACPHCKTDLPLFDEVVDLSMELDLPCLATLPFIKQPEDFLMYLNPITVYLKNNLGVMEAAEQCEEMA